MFFSVTAGCVLILRTAFRRGATVLYRWLSYARHNITCIGRFFSEFLRSFVNVLTCLNLVKNALNLALNLTRL